MLINIVYNHKKLETTYMPFKKVTYYGLFVNSMRYYAPIKMMTHIYINMERVIQFVLFKNFSYLFLE